MTRFSCPTGPRARGGARGSWWSRPYGNCPAMGSREQGPTLVRVPPSRMGHGRTRPGVRDTEAAVGAKIQFYDLRLKSVFEAGEQRCSWGPVTSDDRPGAAGEFRPPGWGLSLWCPPACRGQMMSVLRARREGAWGHHRTLQNHPRMPLARPDGLRKRNFFLPRQAS